MLSQFQRAALWLVRKSPGANAVENDLDTLTEEISWQHNWMVSVIERIRPARILEVGCGLGRNLKFLATTLSYKPELVGSDFNSQMLVHARAYLSDVSVELFEADVKNLPFADDSFDLVLIHGVFTHILPVDVGQALREVQRVSGRYIIQVEEKATKRPGSRRGSVQINQGTWAHNYRSLFATQGLQIIEERSEGSLDGYLLTKKRVKYDLYAELEPGSMKPGSPHEIVLSRVPPNTQVLDVGCSSGYLGRFLITYRGCTVDGLEVDAAAAAIAAEAYRKVWVGSADDPDTLELIQGFYDVVLMAAVLEHLAQPDRTLLMLRRVLRPGAILICNLPNISHWSIRWELLKGHWEYTEYGLLDRTHLRFFTPSSAERLFHQAGFSVLETRWTHQGYGPLDTLLRLMPLGRYRLRRWLLSRFPGLFAYEMIYVLQSTR